MLGKRMHALEWTLDSTVDGRRDAVPVERVQRRRVQNRHDGVVCHGRDCRVCGRANAYISRRHAKSNANLICIDGPAPHGQNAMLYVWGVIFNGTNWILSAMPSADHHGAPVELFGDVGEVQISMVFYAIYGLSISIILKRFGAITRTFINTAAICFTALIDVLFFQARRSRLLELTTFGSSCWPSTYIRCSRATTRRRRRRRPKPRGLMVRDLLSEIMIFLCGSKAASRGGVSRSAHRTPAAPTDASPHRPKQRRRRRDVRRTARQTCLEKSFLCFRLRGSSTSMPLSPSIFM